MHLNTGAKESNRGRDGSSPRQGCVTNYAGASRPRPVRLRAHLNSRVRVPDLADTVEPVTESNCAEAITSGGKQLKVNNQSVTPSSKGGDCELDSVGGI